MTFTVYLSITILTLFLSYFCQKKRIYTSRSFNYFLFFLCFCVHAFFMCFTRVGTDYDEYIRIIKLLSWNTITESIEIGFNFLGLLFYSLTNNADSTLFFIKLLTLVIYYYSFYLIRNRVRIVYSILAFNAFVYFRWYIIGMNLSISILLLSGVLLVEKKKNILPLILVILAALVHSSSWLFIPSYLLCYFLFVKKKRISLIGVLIIVSMYLSIFIFYRQIYSYLIDRFSFFNQYRFYLLIDSNSGSGLLQYINFAFIFIYVLVILNNSNDKRLVFCSLVFTINAFLFALLAYKMTVFSRINNSSLIIYCYFIPCIFGYERWRGTADNKGFVDNKSNICLTSSVIKTKISKNILRNAWVVYLSINFIFLMSQLLSAGSTSSMNEYEFFWPF